MVRAVHTLRGLTSTFDAADAVRISKSIEQLASNCDWLAVDVALGRLEIEANALRDALHEYASGRFVGWASESDRK